MKRRSTRNAPRARVLRGKDLSRAALERLSRTVRVRESSDRSRGDEANVELSPFDRVVRVRLVISARVNTPDDVRFGRDPGGAWDWSKFNSVDVVGMAPEAAADKIADALRKFILKHKTHAEVEREEEASDRFDDVRHRTRFAIEGSMPERARDAINAELTEYVGGKPLFRSVGAAIAKCADILARHGYEWGEVINSHTFLRDSGRTAIDLAQSNADDPFAPAPVEDVALSFQWHKFDTGRVEAIAYVSRGATR
jgi:hypothetical protein